MGLCPRARGAYLQRGSRNEARNSSRLPRDRGPLRLRQPVPDALDEEGRPQRRDLLGVPPVLHGQAEAHRHGRPRRPLQQALRQEDRSAGRDRGCQRLSRPVSVYDTDPTPPVLATQNPDADLSRPRPTSFCPQGTKKEAPPRRSASFFSSGKGWMVNGSLPGGSLQSFVRPSTIHHLLHGVNMSASEKDLIVGG